MSNAITSTPPAAVVQPAEQHESESVRALFDAAYEDLRALARARLRKNGRGALLNTTALVHESFLRFSNAGQLQLKDRAHFLRYASHVMRSVIVDMVRMSMAESRGGDAIQVTLTTQIGESDIAGENEILRVHEALEELAQVDARLAQVVEMRYFAGMTEVETAEALGITERTVRRDWNKARLLLAKALQ